MHEGQALIKIANTYKTILEVILEQIQNGLDVNAKLIRVLIDFQKRAIVCEDDGEGVSKMDFDKALESVGKSQKTRGKLGRYGIGLIAALGKCQLFTFSSGKNGNAYLEWKFNTEEIAKTDRNVRIPVKSRKKGDEWWRTRIEVTNFTQDKVISRVDMVDLIEAILDRYNAVMKKNKVTIDLTIVDPQGKEISKKVRARKHTGKPLEETSVSVEGAGITKFRLFLARGKRGGKVLVGEEGDDYRLTFTQFWKSLFGTDWLPDDVAQALRSGLFEGEIVNDTIKLDESGSRKSFQRNEALQGFCEALWIWFEEHGKNHLRKAQEMKAELRFQELGLQCMRNFESLLNGESGLDLLKVVLSLPGTIGKGHSKVPKNHDQGELEDKTKATRGAPCEPRETPGEKGSDTQESKPRGRQDGHNSNAVQGPSGQTRNLVKGEHGLQLAFDDMPTSSRLWLLDTKKGVLFVNTRHDTFRDCDEKGDKALMRLIEVIMVISLYSESLDPEWKDTLDLCSGDVIDLIGHLLVNSSAFNLRKSRKMCK